MSDRGMKKFAPFASLIEQNDYLSEMKYQKEKIEKPVLSTDKEEDINRILTSYRGEVLEFHYFYDGHIYKLDSKILKIDIYNRKLKLEHGDLPLDKIVDVIRKY